ncbi:MAG: rRNA maturation RNase YbeY [Bacteroidetes bacterium]|nr:MAG: rRNA maturation RNase YbeY [Bacteroidota bacterium]
MPKINFFPENIKFDLKHKTKIKKWIAQVAGNEKYIIENLNYIFCSDAYLLEINQTYLKHDTFTDIITFDNSEFENEIIGDIYISVDRVKENSQKLQLLFEQELYRVMIHGLLHLCGYKDKKPADKQKMTEMEDKSLDLLEMIG